MMRWLAAILLVFFTATVIFEGDVRAMAHRRGVLGASDVSSIEHCAQCGYELEPRDGVHRAELECGNQNCSQSCFYRELEDRDFDAPELTGAGAVLPEGPWFIVILSMLGLKGL